MTLNDFISFLNKYVFKVEVLFILLLIGLCVYVYYKYEKNKIYLDLDYVEYTPLFNVDNFIQQYPFPPTSASVHKKYITELRKPQNVKTEDGKKPWKHEEKCRDIFEKIFNKKFPSVRPDFLKNPITGYNLELDGYCKELNMAFEYDGKQHSEYNSFHHRGGKEEFLYQVKKDDFKTKKCRLEGITLIRIPHYVHMDSLEDYIIRELKKVGKY